MSRKLVLVIILTLVLVCTLAVAFRIQRVEAGVAVYIRADGSIEGTIDISTVDNVTYTFTDNIFNQSIVVERDNIVVDGAGYVVQGTGAWISYGIDLTGRSNVTIKNMETKSFSDGILLDDSSNNNNISGNNITNNDNGVLINSSSNNTFYHNNFLDSSRQVYFDGSSVANFWDDGYLSGGNYWSNYTDVDQSGGPYQTETGSDGMWDHPYAIDENNQDNYPLTDVIPEFSSFLIPRLFMIATLPTVLAYRCIKNSNQRTRSQITKQNLKSQPFSGHGFISVIH